MEDNAVADSPQKSLQMQATFSLLLLVAAVCAVDYCKDISRDHTICKYKGPNCPGRKFGGVIKPADKKAAVDAHNKYRSKVAMGKEKTGPQPSAANMKKLKWDDELAKVAQMWADQCNFQHDSSRNVKRFSVGQNIFKSSSWGNRETDVQDWEAAVAHWYKEVSLVKPSLLNSFLAGDWSHYTQLVWAETEYLGCGFTAYKRQDGGLTKYYVCNYGPGGNMRGKHIYEKGAPCSKCKNGCEKGLCL